MARRSYSGEERCRLPPPWQMCRSWSHIHLEHRPDAAVLIGLQTVAIEVERSAKTPQRLPAMLYGLVHTYAGIRYSCPKALLESLPWARGAHPLEQPPARLRALRRVCPCVQSPLVLVELGMLLAGSCEQRAILCTTNG